MIRHNAAPSTATASASSDAMAGPAAAFTSPGLNVHCSRDDDVILMVPSEEYTLSLLRKQLNNIGFDRSRPTQTPDHSATSSAPSVHFATLTFVQPTTPPTSPQPKDLLRHHMKTRQKKTLDSTNCHIMYVDGMDVRNTSRPGPRPSSSPVDHQFKEGLRKRKSNFMSDDDCGGVDSTDDDDDVAMDPIRESSADSPSPNAQKLADFHRDTYGFHLVGHGNFAACS